MVNALDCDSGYLGASHSSATGFLLAWSQLFNLIFPQVNQAITLYQGGCEENNSLVCARYSVSASQKSIWERDHTSSKRKKSTGVSKSFHNIRLYANHGK